MSTKYNYLRLNITFDYELLLLLNVESWLKRKSKHPHNPQQQRLFVTITNYKIDPITATIHNGSKDNGKIFKNIVPIITIVSELYTILEISANPVPVFLEPSVTWSIAC